MWYNSVIVEIRMRYHFSLVFQSKHIIEVRGTFFVWRWEKEREKTINNNLRYNAQINDRRKYGNKKRDNAHTHSPI